MLAIVAAGILAWLGWRRQPWHRPIAAWLLLLPVAALHISASSSWRREIGLASAAATDIAISLALQLVLLLASYWLGRGLARLAGR